MNNIAWLCTCFRYTAKKAGKATLSYERRDWDLTAQFEEAHRNAWSR